MRQARTATQGQSAQVASATKSWSSQFRSFGSVVKGVLAVEAVRYVAQFTASLAKAASDQGEALNKVDVVFEKSAGVVEDYAERAAQAAGISKTAALDAAGGFGTMLKTAGLASDQAADMSVRLVQLAGDLASFNNIDPSEALEKLRSGLAGEAEPLRTVGVLLSEARVKAEAYASGIAKNGEELTEAQKVQARFNLILQDTTLSQGDFARTAEGAANSQRTLNAEWEDAKAEMGQAVLPLFKDLLGLMRGAIPVAQFLAEHITQIGAAFASWLIIAKVVGPIVSAISSVKAASAVGGAAVFLMGKRVEGVTKASGGLRAALNSGVSALNAWALAAGLAVAAAMELRDFFTADDQQAREWTEAILAGEASLGAYRTAVHQVTGDSGLSDMWNGDRQALSALEQTEQQVQAAIVAANEKVLAGTEIYGRYRTELDSTANANLELHGRVAAALKSVEDFNVELTDGEDKALRNALAHGELKRALSILSGALGLSTDREKDQAAAHRDTAAAAREERAAELQLAGGLLGLISSVRQVQDAQSELADLRRHGKQGTDEYTDAELNLLESQQSLLASFADYRDELRQTGSSQAEVKQKLIEMGRQVGLTKDEVQRLIDKLGGYAHALDRLPKSKTITITTNYVQTGVGPAGFKPLPNATGGIVRAAHGLIARGPVILAGEGSYATPFGQGAEAVLPLDSRGIGILAKALGMALERSGGGIVTLDARSVQAIADALRHAPLVARMDPYEAKRGLDRLGVRRGGV
jgi:hypothetical protein